MDSDENPHMNEHPPDIDIDQYVKDCNFRIERMGDDSIWLCAYTDDSDEPEHHYDITATDSGELHVTHRRERVD